LFINLSNKINIYDSDNCLVVEHQGDWMAVRKQSRRRHRWIKLATLTTMRGPKKLHRFIFAIALSELHLL